MTVMPPVSPDTAASATDGAEKLAVLVHLEQRGRAATTRQDLVFVMVNDTRALTDFRRALWWNAATGRIEGCSGLAGLDRQAPALRWLERVCAAHGDGESARVPSEVTARSIGDRDAGEWPQHVSTRLFWLPLSCHDQPLVGALLLERDHPPSDADQAVLRLACDAYAHAWSALAGKRSDRPPLTPRSRRLWLAVSVAALLLCLAPVRLSVLAPAEIVARDPAVLRAPLQAVVEQILVRPNQEISAGTPVAQLDTREWESRLHAARQELAVADAEFRQAQQQALFDDRAGAALASLRGRLAQARAEVTFVEDTLQRMTVTSPRAGIAIFDDPADWIGRPVAQGERIMQVAAPDDGEIEILLPVADAIALEPGVDIRLFLNSEPAAPLDARLDHVGYRASPTPDGFLAYRLRASFNATDPRIRVGLKGNAKLHGRSTILALYLLRRPLTALRAILGW